MRNHLAGFIILAFVAAFVLTPARATAAPTCESLASLKIPQVTITSATEYTPPKDLVIPIPASPFASAGNLEVPVTLCRVVAFATPTSDSHITFEVWLPPAASWNGKLQSVGNGGFIGKIAYGALSNALKLGYAAAGTDTGHAGGNDESWAMGHPEKVIDWSYRAVHLMTLDAKQIIRTYYGSPARLAYWNGCSTGGKQGLTEAQKFPSDYDAIIAGAPANYITHLQAGSEYMSWVSLRNGINAPEYIPPSKYPVIHRAALNACDARDGVADGVIEDPSRCHFDVRTIECHGADGPSCLTAPQVKTAQALYAGAKFADGRQIYPGMEPGSELAWGAMAGGPEPISIGTGFFMYMVFADPKWDFRTFHVDRDTRLADSRLGSTMNAIDPNLKRFRARGGKIITYHGWADQLISPGNSVNYYRSVTAVMGGPKNTQEFFRLFMVPGMTHCEGGTGPTSFDMLGPLEHWREHGIPPAKIIASHSTHNTVDETRPLCPYPQAAIYKGSGDTNDAANFVCGNPTW